MNEIIVMHTDAFEMLGALEDNSVDLMFLDPDYQQWGELLERGLLDIALSKLRPEGNVLCFTKQPFDFKLRAAADPYFRREIVWTFTNGGAWVSNRLPLVSHQKIYHLVKDAKQSYFNSRTGMDYAESTKSFKRATKVFEGYHAEGREFEKSEDGVWLRDHLHFNKPSTGKIPSKPQELLDVLVKCYCPRGGLVVDPFVGSGNVAVSCKRQNKSFIGSEHDKETYLFAQNNINNT